MLRWLLLLALPACGTDAIESEDLCGNGRIDGIERCDDGNNIAGDGCSADCEVAEPPADVQWSFYPSVAGPPMTECRAGVAAVELHTDLGTSAVFPCELGRGSIFAPPQALVLARIVDASGTTIAESPPHRITKSVQDREIEVHAKFYEDAGFARIGWRFAPFDKPSACGETLDLILRVTSTEGTLFATQTFPCLAVNTGFVFVTPALPEGTYSFTFEGIRGQTTLTVPIGRNNAITDLLVTTP